jgi:isopenicillin-N epimerase
MIPSSQSVKNQFQLDSRFIYLNHGSFGACPKPIFQERNKWQLEIEKQPVSFIEDKAIKLLDWSREKLGSFINCDKDDLVYFPNPTTAMNMVIKSLDLKPGDEVLSSNHEYGAVERTWKFMEKKKGFIYKSLDIPLPFDEDQFVSSFKENINDNTKVLFISHITSPTGIIFPVDKICQLAKDSNIITIIDGAHVPAHIDLNIVELGADIYTGACHKWMLCPKGVSFLYSSKKMQKQLEPLVVSWGWESDTPSHSKFLDYHQYQGTNDISGYLSVPMALEFLKKNNWDEVRKDCHKKIIESKDVLLKTLKSSPICSDDYLGQMVSLRIDVPDSMELYTYLKENNIVVPVIDWNGFVFVRVSFQCYNSMEDIETLNHYLKKYLDRI